MAGDLRTKGITLWFHVFVLLFCFVFGVCVSVRYIPVPDSCQYLKRANAAGEKSPPKAFSLVKRPEEEQPRNIESFSEITIVLRNNHLEINIVQKECGSTSSDTSNTNGDPTLPLLPNYPLGW